MKISRRWVFRRKIGRRWKTPDKLHSRAVVQVQDLLIAGGGGADYRIRQTIINPHARAKKRTTPSLNL